MPVMSVKKYHLYQEFGVGESDMKLNEFHSEKEKLKVQMLPDVYQAAEVGKGNINLELGAQTGKLRVEENDDHLRQAAEVEKGKMNLEFGAQTGKLREVPERGHAILASRSIASTGLICGSLIISPRKENIRKADIEKRRIDVKTMHISCKSDTYQPGHNYAGIIVYQYNGKTEWRTANNTHCKCGYIVIQDTDSESVKRWKDEPGKVHGAIYKNAFGESVNDAHVVGEGFSLQNGKSKIEINSSVFNNPKGSIYHDNRRRMHELTEHCVRKIVECWKTAGPCWVRQQNFEVKQLLETFDKKSKKRDVACTLF